MTKIKNKSLIVTIVIILLSMIMVTPTKANDYTDHFSGEGVPIYYSNIAYTWGGWTYETVTEELIGYNEKTDSAIYRYRYYLVQWGPSGSKTRQTAPVQVFMDGQYKGVFDITYLGYFSNRCQFGGQVDIEGKVGSIHHITIKDDPNYSGNWTTVNWEGDRPFVLPSYTVNFKDWDNSLIKKEVVKKYKDATPPPNPLRPGYAFTGWKGDYKRVTSNRDIIAQYKVNLSPSISAEDRWFYDNEIVDKSRLMEKVSATDPEEGDLTNQVIISSNNVKSGVIGDYNVTYQVTDSYQASASKTVSIHIIGSDAEKPTVKRVRAISKKYLYTLHEKSIWRTNAEYNSLLVETLNKEPNDENAEQIWVLTPEDRKKINKQTDDLGFGVDAYNQFLTDFSYCRKK